MVFTQHAGVAGRRRSVNRGAELLSAAAIVLLFAVCGSVYYCAALLGYDRYYPNTYIDGKPVGGKTVTEVREMFDDKAALTAKSMVVTVDDSSWPVDLSKISAHYMVAEAENMAFQTGREGGALQRLGEILALRGDGKNYTIDIGFDEAALRTQVEKISADFTVKPQDARLDFRPDTKEAFVVTNEVNGRTVDDDALFSALKAKITKGDFTTLKYKSVKLTPAATAESLAAGTQLIGTCTTALTDDNQRNQNITLAAQAVNGTVLQPGEVFSFNDSTGERTAATGYVEAPAISNAQLVDAAGGGVCQVTTTVYDAALQAGLEIVERHHHTWPMSYAQAGLDATVDFGNKDLRLKNAGDSPIYLIVRADTDQHTLTTEIYGKKADETVAVEVDNIEKIKPDSPIETKNPRKYIGYRHVVTMARDGARVKVYRVYSKNGSETRRDLVSEDYYAPVQGEVEVGSKQPPSDDGNK